jgi:hypothetical protein
LHIVYNMNIVDYNKQFTLEKHRRGIYVAL